MTPARSSPSWSPRVQAEHDAGRRRRLRGLVDAARPTGARPTRSATTTPDDGSLAPQYVIERLGADRRAGRDLRRRRRPAPDVGRAVHQLREARHLAELRRRRDDGLRGPGRDGRQGRPPDATVWAIDGDGCFQMTNQELATCAHQRHPDQGRHHQQRQPRHGPPVADPVLQRALLQHRALARRTAAHPRLRQAGRGAAAASACAARRPDDVDATIEKAMAINDRTGRRRLHRPRGRDGVADGRRRHQQRRHHGRARHRARLGHEED